MLRRWFPYRGHCVADLDGEVELRPGEALGRVLKCPPGLRLQGRALPDQLRPRDRDICNSHPIEPEDDTSLRGGG